MSTVHNSIPGDKQLTKTDLNTTLMQNMTPVQNMSSVQAMSLERNILTDSNTISMQNVSNVPNMAVQNVSTQQNVSCLQNTNTVSNVSGSQNVSTMQDASIKIQQPQLSSGSNNYNGFRMPSFQQQNHHQGPYFQQLLNNQGSVTMQAGINQPYGQGVFTHQAAAAQDIKQELNSGQTASAPVYTAISTPSQNQGGYFLTQMNLMAPPYNQIQSISNVGNTSGMYKLPESPHVPDRDCEETPKKQVVGAEDTQYVPPPISQDSQDVKLLANNIQSNLNTNLPGNEQLHCVPYPCTSQNQPTQLSSLPVSNVEPPTWPAATVCPSGSLYSTLPILIKASDGSLQMVRFASMIQNNSAVPVVFSNTPSHIQTQENHQMRIPFKIQPNIAPAPNKSPSKQKKQRKIQPSKTSNQALQPQSIMQHYDGQQYPQRQMQAQASTSSDITQQKPVIPQQPTDNPLDFLQLHYSGYDNRQSENNLQRPDQQFQNLPREKVVLPGLAATRNNSIGFIPVSNATLSGEIQYPIFPHFQNNNLNTQFSATQHVQMQGNNQRMPLMNIRPATPSIPLPQVRCPTVKFSDINAPFDWKHSDGEKQLQHKGIQTSASNNCIRLKERSHVEAPSLMKVNPDDVQNHVNDNVRQDQPATETANMKKIAPQMPSKRDTTLKLKAATNQNHQNMASKTDKPTGVFAAKQHDVAADDSQKCEDSAQKDNSLLDRSLPQNLLMAMNVSNAVKSPLMELQNIQGLSVTLCTTQATDKRPSLSSYDETPDIKISRLEASQCVSTTSKATEKLPITDATCDAVRPAIKDIPKATVRPHVLTHVIGGYVIQESSEPFKAHFREGDVACKSEVSKTDNISEQKQEAIIQDITECPVCRTLRKPYDICCSFIEKTFLDNAPGARHETTIPEKPENNGDIITANVQDSVKSTDREAHNRSPADGEARSDNKKEMKEVIDSQNEQNDVENWNVDRVCEFIGGLPGCSEYADQFFMQEIDGQALLLIRPEHLVSVMSLRLGPALKIVDAVKNLFPKKDVSEGSINAGNAYYEDKILTLCHLSDKG